VDSARDVCRDFINFEIYRPSLRFFGYDHRDKVCVHMFIGMIYIYIYKCKNDISMVAMKFN
jgi:hypothetical protein